MMAEGKKTKILLVDEDQAVQKRISALFKAQDFELQLALDGMMAIHEVRRQKPDLILMNINLPGGGGLLTLKRLKQMNSTAMIPVIMYTNEEAEEFKPEALALGAADYISKETSDESLLEKILKVLEGKSSIEELDSVLWRELEANFIESTPENWMGVIAYLLDTAGHNPQLYQSAKTFTHLHYKTDNPNADKLCLGFGALAAAAALYRHQVAAAMGINGLLQDVSGSEKVCSHIKEWASKVAGDGEFKLEWLGTMNSKFESLLGDVFSFKRSPAKTKQVSLFRNLNAAQVYEVLEKSSPKTYSRGQIIFKEGDRPQEFFIIVDGILRIESSLGGLHRLFDHDFFGEVSLLLNRPKHFHQAVAETDLEVLSFSKESLVEVFTKFPEIESHIESQLAFRSFLNHNIEAHMFDDISVEEQNELFFLFKVKRVNTGHKLFTENSGADQFYLLLEGSIGLSEKGTPLRRVDSGRFIGELAFLEERKHSMTATVLEDSILLSVDRQDFKNVQRSHPNFEFLLKELASFRRVENRTSGVQRITRPPN